MCMPTKNDWQELINKDNCTWNRETKGGKAGYRVTGPNGRSIFLPTAGYRDGTSVKTNYGYYWMSSLSSDITQARSCAILSEENITQNKSDRRYGLIVRPVRKVRK